MDIYGRSQPHKEGWTDADQAAFGMVADGVPALVAQVEAREWTYPYHQEGFVRWQNLDTSVSVLEPDGVVWEEQSADGRFFEGPYDQMGTYL